MVGFVRRAKKGGGQPRPARRLCYGDLAVIMFPSALRTAGTCLVLAMVLACRPATDDAANAGDNGVAPPIQLPVAEAPLDREDLLLAVFRASSAYAVGADDGVEQSRLDGKPFEVRFRFGCPGLADSRAVAAATFSDRRSIALRATPNINREDPAIARLDGVAFEAVEGFWLNRPWMLEASCPVVRTAEAESADRTEAGQNASAGEAPAPEAATDANGRESDAVDRPAVGIAQFFTETDPRTHRRDGRPYSTTKALPPETGPSEQGYDLVLSGRLRRLPDGRVIVCSSPAVDIPPACVVSVNFDRVRFERADTKQMLAEWARS